MKTGVVLAIVLIGCGPETIRVSGSSFAYQPGGTDWTWQHARLTAPRAGHSLVAVPGRAFLVIGGDTGLLSGTTSVEPTLEIERCVIDQQDCVVIGRLARATEQPEVARAPDGSIVIADHQGMQLFDPTTGTTGVLDAIPQKLVETADGVVVLGIEGPEDPTRPWSHGVVRDRTRGIEPISSPPGAAWIQTATASDDHHVLIASRDGSALLDVATSTWTPLPAVPTDQYSLRSVRAGEGVVLVVSDGEASAFVFSTATGTLAAVPVPSTSDYVQHILGVADGGVVITHGYPGDGETRMFRLRDQTWIAGPAAPPWSILNATTVLDDGTVISVGGCDQDFIGWRGV